jgi:hypothetical protein
MTSKPKSEMSAEQNENNALKTFVTQEGGKFFSDFKLFHRTEVTSIDTLIFLPNFGIFLGETITWRASELKTATVERSSKRTKRPAATHFETLESKVRHKLDDVLSFHTTPIYRFIWMKNLTEEEFDALDPSFHQLLPQKYLLFHTENLASVKDKLYRIGEYRHEPYSSVKILGALNSHAAILPTKTTPSAALLSPQQNLFLTSPIEGSMTLLGGYGSGKSTLLIRKALLYMLSHPAYKMMIITPTLLGGELLRNEIVSLLEYGAIRIDLSALYFYTPLTFEIAEVDRLETLKSFQESSLFLCDDVHLFKDIFLDKLRLKIRSHPLICTSISPYSSDTTFSLSGRFRRTPTAKEISPPLNQSTITLLMPLRKHLTRTTPSEILIAVSNNQEALYIKEAIDEYFDFNCRLLTSTFSLQYQDLDSIIVAPVECVSPICRGHVILLGIDPCDANYSLALSRASETLTIISCNKSAEEITHT